MPRSRPRALAFAFAFLLAACPSDDGADTGAPLTDATSADPTAATAMTATTAATASSTTAAATSTAGTSTGEETTADASTSAADTDTGDSDSDSDSDTGMMVGPPTVFLPKQSLAPEELAVVVNTQDPQSVAVAAYYVEHRQIPAENVVELAFPAEAVLTPELFAPLKAEIDALDPSIQALALTWVQPYRVGCMSVTSAFALGFDPKYCSQPCNPTAPSPYYNSESLAPFTDHGVRPAMAIAAATLDDALDLIDRGVAADGTFPTGDGVLIRTTDVARSVRWPDFIATVDAWKHPEGLTLTYLDNSGGQGKDYVSGAQDLLFYFTGLAQVPEIASNTYRPGAVADHLTSYGGQIPESGQMSIIRWIEAGVTASYGTVVEPCNYPTKFPSTSVLLPHYFRGQTILEAYWKSVAWPGEGVFVGEPLARPWGGSAVDWQGGALTITTTLLKPGKAYHLEAADAESGPWTPVLQDISIPAHQRLEIVLDPAPAPFYRLSEQG